MDSKRTSAPGHARWTPASGASIPDAYPPHPPLQSGGWYRGTVTELPGPGRPPVVAATGNRAPVTYLTATVFALLALLLLL